MSAGPHTLTAVAVDVNGGAVAAAPMAVTVDNRARVSLVYDPASADLSQALLTVVAYSTGFPSAPAIAAQLELAVRP